MKLMNTTSILLSILSFVKFSAPPAPNVEKQDWDRLNAELKSQLAPLHHAISTASAVEIPALGDSLTLQLRDFLVANSDFFEDESSKNPTKEYVSHPNETITELEVLKKTLRKEAFGNQGTPDKRKEFMTASKLSVS